MKHISYFLNTVYAVKYIEEECFFKTNRLDKNIKITIFGSWASAFNTYIGIAQITFFIYENSNTLPTARL